jgi:hypothetical protein
VLATAACGGQGSLAWSTFEGDDEGWTLSGNGDATVPTLKNADGNPGGNLCGQDKADGDIWYFVAPPKYLGNATVVYGKRLTFDLVQGSNYNQIRGRDVVLNGGGLALTWNSKFAPGMDWTPYSVRIDDTSGWIIDDTTGHGPAATESDIKTVLKNLTSLRLRGEFYDGPNDTACLDNVYFGVP